MHGVIEIDDDGLSGRQRRRQRHDQIGLGVAGEEESRLLTAGHRLVQIEGHFLGVNALIGVHAQDFERLGEQADFIARDNVATVGVEDDFVNGLGRAVGPGDALADVGDVSGDVEVDVEIVVRQPLGGGAGRRAGSGAAETVVVASRASRRPAKGP